MAERSKLTGMLGVPWRTLDGALWLATSVGFLWLMAYALPRQPMYALIMCTLGVSVFALGLTRPEWALRALVVVIPGITTSSVTVFNLLQPAIPIGVFGPAVLVPVMAFVLGVWARAWIWREPTALLCVRPWLLGFLGLSVLSAGVTCWRYSDFWPLCNRPYIEPTVNIEGMPAFDAYIRVVWTLANYVSGPLLFFAVCHTAAMARARAAADWSWRVWLLGTILVPLWLGSVVPFLIGRYQTVDVWFGANRVYVWPWMNRINASFFDPNALGAYLILIVPWILALAALLGARQRLHMVVVLTSIVMGIVTMPWLNRALCLVMAEHGVGAYSILTIAWVLTGVAMLLANRTWPLLVPVGVACGMVVRMSTILAAHAGSRTAVLGLFVSGAAVVLLLSLQTLLRLRSVVSARVMRLIVCAMAVVYVAAAVWLFYDGAPRMRAWLQRQPRLNTLPLVKRLNQLPLGSFKQLYRQIMVDRGPHAILALGMIRDAPLTGVGLGAFLTELPNWKQRERQVIYVPDTACNYYLQIGAEQGIIALAVMLVVFGLWWRVWWRIWTAGVAHTYVLWIGAGMVSMLTMFIFGMHTLAHEIQALFWIYLAQVFVAGTDEPCTWHSRFRWLVYGLIGVIIVVQSAAQLSLKAQRRNFGWQLRIGFYPMETYGGSTMPIRYTHQQATEVLTCEGVRFVQPWACFHPAISSTPVEVTFSIGTVQTNLLATDNIWHTLALDVPFAMLGQPADYHVTVSRTWTGKEAGLNLDTRPLGVALQHYSWDSASGLYEPETWMQDESRMAGATFRWSSGNVRMLVNAQNPFLHVPVLIPHPDVAQRPVTLTFAINDCYVTSCTYAAQGWQEERLFIWDVVTPHSLACLGIGVSRTWQPMDFGITDARVMGIGVGTPYGSDSGGFYPVEVWPTGFRYAWSSGAAWWAQQADSNGVITLHYLIGHPDAALSPVTFALSSAVLSTNARITETGWRTLTARAEPLRWYEFYGAVDRTWNPSAHGSNDDRELGFALRR